MSQPTAFSFPVRRTEVSIAAGSFSLDVVADPEALLDALIARTADDPDLLDDRLPYWAELWHSAIALSRVLTRVALPRPGMRTTELGCGLGLPGIVAGASGAAVCFTDYLPEALQFAQHNWSLNHAHAARFLPMDWRTPDDSAAADLLLAADVAYEARFFPVLYQVFERLLLPGGTLLLAEPGRVYAQPFVAGLRERFRVSGEWRESVALDGVTREVLVLALRRNTD
jgi:predicted nicotinamide N-methyase